MIRRLSSDDPHIRWEVSPLLEAEREALWKNIKRETVNRNPGRFFSPRNLRLWLIPAAAIAAVVVGLVLLFDGGGERRGEEKYMSILLGDDDDFDPRTGDVVLRSGDQSVNVATDSAEVVYDDRGHPAVNSRELAPKNTPRKENNEELDLLMVPYGKKAELTLSDGTKIWVNSGSRLLYRSVFAADRREVWLTGEACFEVAKDEARPFIIKTDRLDVVVRGTTLNVSAYASESLQTVALVSGRVDVTGHDGKAVYKMEPNQLFSYDQVLDEAGISNVDVNQYTSWTRGYLMLDDESLDRLLARIDRHYNVRIRYDADRMRSLRVRGKLDLQQGLDRLLEYITIAMPIACETGPDGGVTVTSKR